MAAGPSGRRRLPMARARRSVRIETFTGVCLLPKDSDRDDWFVRLRASHGSPPPLSPAIGPLVARVASSAPRLSPCEQPAVKATAALPVLASLPRLTTCTRPQGTRFLEAVLAWVLDD